MYVVLCRRVCLPCVICDDDDDLPMTAKEVMICVRASAITTKARLSRVSFYDSSLPKLTRNEYSCIKFKILKMSPPQTPTKASRKTEREEWDTITRSRVICLSVDLGIDTKGISEMTGVPPSTVNRILRSGNPRSTKPKPKPKFSVRRPQTRTSLTPKPKPKRKSPRQPKVSNDDVNLVYKDLRTNDEIDCRNGFADMVLKDITWGEIVQRYELGCCESTVRRAFEREGLGVRGEKGGRR